MSKSISEIHQNLIPADVRDGTPIKAFIKGRFNGDSWEQHKVWRISPLGVEIVIDEEFPLQVGDQVDLKIELPDEKCDFSGVFVGAKEINYGRNIIGIRWFQEVFERHKDVDNRIKARWLCPQEFMPNGVAANPVRFNDFIYFRVHDISAGGMQIVTSLRNKFLIPGMHLETTISFPLVSQVNILFRVLHARVIQITGKEYLAVGGKFENLDQIAKEAVGQYVFQFGPASSIAMLKEQGLILKSAKSGIEFTYVKSKNEYLEVLELRKTTYILSGKLSPDALADELADVYDTRSRILIAKHNGKIVGSLRLVFTEDGEPTEQEQHVKFSDDFPLRHEVVEITRVCTHPEYRGNDLLMGLFAEAAKAILDAKRRWVIGSSKPELLGMYKKLGFFDSGLTYEHEKFKGEKQVVFVGDIFKAVSGLGINPIIWNIVFSDLVHFLQETDLIQFGGIPRLRIAILRLIKPLALFLYRLRSKKN